MAYGKFGRKSFSCAMYKLLFVGLTTDRRAAIPSGICSAVLSAGGRGDTRCKFGGDNLGVAVEEQNGQRPGEPPHPRWDSKRTTTRGGDSEQDLQRAGLGLEV